MEIITDTVDFYIERETSVALGKFDGIHIGHRRLLEEIVSRRDSGNAYREGKCPESGGGQAACVFTFDPPATAFFGVSDGKELTTRDEKRLLFERMGVDILIEFPLNRETAGIEPEAFAREILAQRMNTCFLAAGTDLSFGAGGAGNAALLRRLGPQLGFTISIIDKICLEGREVSSTLVRAEVEKGQMESAARLLGMPYMIAGKVSGGKRLGRTLGFPTVNLIPPDNKLLPPNGVYFSDVRVKGRLYHAVTNIGYKPTVTEERCLGVESYLYDFQEEIYGEPIEVYLHSFHRPEKRFDSIQTLREQLQRDIAAGANRAV